MPVNNRFRHQQYTADPPKTPYHLVRAPTPLELDSDAYCRRMRAAGDRLRSAGVAAVYLLHGTFAGNDAFGLFAELERFVPSLGGSLRDVGKLLFDKVARDAGNYTPQFARRLEEGINSFPENGTGLISGDAAMRSPTANTQNLDLSRFRHIPVRRFHWSSQNHHLGRADGAVRLIGELAALDLPADSRVLLCGHSHAGNVFALITNLLAGDATARKAFFAATRGYYRMSLLGRRDVPEWQQVKRLLRADGNPLGDVQLDFVTFGTPIRYGWDSDGYDRLLHVIHHRPAEDLPEYRAPFPPQKEDILTAAHGDCIQQLAIAGTNLPPNVLLWRAFMADRRLGALLQPGLRRRDLVQRLSVGRRVPDESTTLLVDYGPAQGTVAQHLAGHAVYTREEHALFHAETIARHLYGDTATT